MKNTFRIILFALLTFSCFIASADQKIYLTSLSWPPYSDKKLPDQGASVAVAKAAFKAMNYELVVDFYPWSRAVNNAKDTGSKYVGYFPEYYSKEIAKEFIFSDEMGSGPLGFVQKKSNAIKWENLNDLSQYKIGTVQDYVNTEEFDQNAANGKINVKTVVSDLHNIRKVAATRIDLAVIDKNVLSYLLKSEPELSQIKNELEFNSKLLANKKLYICFRKGPEGDRLTKIFNEGIKKIDVDKIMTEHLSL